MTPRMLGCIAGALLVVGSSEVTAQSLAELARQEKSRRAELTEKAGPGAEEKKVYTNADLRSSGRLTTGSAPAPSSRPPAETPAAEASAEAATPPAEAATPPPDEDAWRSRISAVRQAQQRAELMAEALQNRVDTLWTDFTSRDDPAQRAVLEQDRQAAVDELDESRRQIDALTQELEDIRTEARRANVPAAWLR